MTTQAGGTIIWHELMSRDPDASERFYGDVVGLSVVPAGEGPEAYRMLVANGRPIGGVTGPRPGTDVWPSGGPAGHWIGYFESADVDAAAAKAKALGGDVRLGPLDVPGVGRVAVLRDPDGATFGLFHPAQPAG